MATSASELEMINAEIAARQAEQSQGGADELAQINAEIEARDAERQAALEAQVSGGEAALRGAAQGATLSTQPFLSAGVEAAAGGVQELLTGRSPFGEDTSFSDRFQRSLGTQLEQRELAQEARPGAFTAGQVGGAIVTAPLMIKALGARTASLAGQAALEGVAASSPNSLEGVTKEAAMGAGGSVLLSGLTRGLSRFIPAGGKKGVVKELQRNLRKGHDAIADDIGRQSLRARAIGATTELRGTNQDLSRSQVIKSVKNLDKKGFFKSGEGIFNPKTNKFEKIKPGILPPSQEELLIRAESGRRMAQEETEKLLKTSSKIFKKRPDLGLSKVKFEELPLAREFETALRKSQATTTDLGGLRRGTKFINDLKGQINRGGGSDILRLQEIKKDLGRQLNTKFFDQQNLPATQEIKKRAFVLLKNALEQKTDDAINILKTTGGAEDIQRSLGALKELNQVQSNLITAEGMLGKALGRSRGSTNLPGVKDLVQTLTIGSVANPVVAGTSLIASVSFKGPRGQIFRAASGDFLDKARAKPQLLIKWLSKSFPKQAERLGLDLQSGRITISDAMTGLSRNPSILTKFIDEGQLFSVNPKLGIITDPGEMKDFQDNLLNNDEGEGSSIERAKRLNKTARNKPIIAQPESE